VQVRERRSNSHEEEEKVPDKNGEIILTKEPDDPENGGDQP
jgi:hypothetical protein